MSPIWRLLAPTFGIPALLACLLGLERADGAVILSQPLTLDGSEHVDQIDSTAFPDDQYLGRFWTFSGQGGDVVELKVERLEADFDPFVWIFQGIFQDTDEFMGGFSEYIDEDDLGFLAFADGGLPPYVPGGVYDTEDVRVTFALPQLGWADYTIIVTSFISGLDDGGDGHFDYRISALVTPSDSNVVPEPSTAALLALGLLGWAGARMRRSRHGPDRRT
jgi:hypothetical protein